MRRGPYITVVMATWDTEPRLLEHCVGSVLAQSYSNWELCIADDGSTRPETLALLDRIASFDDRIRLHRAATHRGMSTTQNAALGMARGDFVALLDHDDELHPEALREVAAVVRRHPDCDVIYTDEDLMGMAGQTLGSFLKPAWSPELLLGCHYLNHLTAYRRQVVMDVGGFREDYVLAQDWDLALRVTALTDRVHHIPRPLYRWRTTKGSASSHPDAQYWRRRCIEEHARSRFGPDTECRDSPVHGWFQVCRPVLGHPLVSVVMPTAGQHRRVRGRRLPVVLNCLDSLLSRTEYQHYEVICVVDPRTGSDVRAAVEAVEDERVRVVLGDSPFNFSERVNLGAVQARGDHLLLLNDDIEITVGEWMTAMLELSQDPGVGVVGAKLRFPDGAIQHGGVALHGAYPYHPFRGYDGEHPGHLGSLILSREFTAVTGACLMTRTDVFQRLGGLDPHWRLNFGDVDYCLRARELGYRVVCTPRADLVHYECTTRPVVRTDEELAAWLARWKAGGDDPYWRLECETAQSYFLRCDGLDGRQRPLSNRKVPTTSLRSNRAQRS